MNKTTITSITLVMLGLLIITGVSAYRGDNSIVGPNYDEATHEALEAAIEAGDYQAWKTIREEAGLPTRGRMFSVINEDNFATYQTLHEANMAGDVDTAQEIRASLGLGLGQGRGNKGQGMHQTNFVDADNNGLCDSYPNTQGNQGQGRGRNR